MTKDCPNCGARSVPGLRVVRWSCGTFRKGDGLVVSEPCRARHSMREQDAIHSGRE